MKGMKKARVWLHDTQGTHAQSAPKNDVSMETDGLKLYLLSAPSLQNVQKARHRRRASSALFLSSFGLLVNYSPGFSLRLAMPQLLLSAMQASLHAAESLKARFTATACGWPVGNDFYRRCY